jgi:hypothetical protein
MRRKGRNTKHVILDNTTSPFPLPRRRGGWGTPPVPPPERVLSGLSFIPFRTIAKGFRPLDSLFVKKPTEPPLKSSPDSLLQHMLHIVFKFTAETIMFQAKRDIGFKPTQRCAGIITDTA